LWHVSPCDCIASRFAARPSVQCRRRLASLLVRRQAAFLNARALCNSAATTGLQIAGAGDATTITRRWFFGGKYPPTRACVGDTLAFAYEQGPHNVYVLDNGTSLRTPHELSSFGGASHDAP